MDHTTFYGQLCDYILVDDPEWFWNIELPCSPVIKRKDIDFCIKIWGHDWFLKPNGIIFNRVFMKNNFDLF